MFRSNKDSGNMESLRKPALRGKKEERPFTTTYIRLLARAGNLNKI